MRFNSETTRALRVITLAFLASCASALYFVVDRLDGINVGHIDGKDHFSSATFLFNWLIWIVTLIGSLYFVRFLKFIVRPNG